MTRRYRVPGPLSRAWNLHYTEPGSRVRYLEPGISTIQNQGPVSRAWNLHYTEPRSRVRYLETGISTIQNHGPGSGISSLESPLYRTTVPGPVSRAWNLHNTEPRSRVRYLEPGISTIQNHGPGSGISSLESPLYRTTVQGPVSRAWNLHYTEPPHRTRAAFNDDVSHLTDLLCRRSRLVRLSDLQSDVLLHEHTMLQYRRTSSDPHRRCHRFRQRLEIQRLGSVESRDETQVVGQS